MRFRANVIGGVVVSVVLVALLVHTYQGRLLSPDERGPLAHGAQVASAAVKASEHNSADILRHTAPTETMATADGPTRDELLRRDAVQREEIGRLQARVAELEKTTDA